MKTWGWGRREAQRLEQEIFTRKIILGAESLLCFLQSMDGEEGFSSQRSCAKQGMANFGSNQSNASNVGQLYRSIMFIYLLFAQLKH